MKVLGAERSFFPVTVTKRILKTYICSPHEDDDDLLGHHHYYGSSPMSGEQNPQQKKKVEGRSFEFVGSATLLG